MSSFFQVVKLSAPGPYGSRGLNYNVASLVRGIVQVLGGIRLPDLLPIIKIIRINE